MQWQQYLRERKDGEVLVVFVDVFPDHNRGGLSCYFRRQDGAFLHVHERDLSYFQGEHGELLDPHRGDVTRQRQLSPERLSLIAREAAACTNAAHKLAERRNDRSQQQRPAGDITGELFARLRHNHQVATTQTTALLKHLQNKPE